MKKNDWILLATVTAYSFLFYKQSAGINFTLFTLLLITALLIKDEKLLKSATWKLAAVGSLLSSLCIGYFATGLAVTTNILSLSLLSALSYSPKTSVLISLLFSCYSYASALVMMFVDWQSRKLKSGSQSGVKWRLIIGPVIITLIFFLMYRASNALFNNFAKNINLDIVSWHWILFTTGGLILAYGFFYHQQIEPIAETDRTAVNEINPHHVKEFKWFGKTIPIQDEEFSGKLLFILLNLLLLIVNGLDFQFMFISKQLPQGITYSEFVHQGTGMLITSLLVAIGIILFYFRGALNFSERSKPIKALACFWIIQNAVMILSTVFRNNIYVLEYGLTYKRIGVYIYLLLAFIGLITTAIKIVQHKSTAYLFRINGWIFYGILVSTAFVNWDRLIATFNMTKSKQVHTEYLLKLSYTNLPKLYAYENTILAGNKNIHADEALFKRSRDKQLYFFLKSLKELNWKSWYMDSERIHHELQALNRSRGIKELDLCAVSMQSMNALYELDQLLELNVSQNDLSDAKELQNFLKLTKLDIRNNKFKSLKGIEVLKNLENLNVCQNAITDYSPLYNLKQLESLTIDKSITNYQYEVLQKNLPETTIFKK